jgi:hypothetical protein
MSGTCKQRALQKGAVEVTWMWQRLVAQKLESSFAWLMRRKCLCFLDQPKTTLALKNPWPPKFVPTRFTTHVLGCSLYSRTRLSRGQNQIQIQKSRKFWSLTCFAPALKPSWIYAQNISYRVYNSDPEWCNTKKPLMLTIWVSAGR